MSDNCRLIEGDGLVTNFFYFLWKKKSDALQSTAGPGTGGAHPGSNSGGSVRGSIAGVAELSAAYQQQHANTNSNHSVLPWMRGPPIPISPDFTLPSTVIFEHNYPKAWYFPHATTTMATPAGGGQAVPCTTWDVERKLGKDIDSHSILKNFCPRSAAALEALQHRHGGGGGGDRSGTSGGDRTGGSGGSPSSPGAGGSGGGAGGGGGSGPSMPMDKSIEAVLSKYEELDIVAAYFATVKPTSAPLQPTPPATSPSPLQPHPPSAAAVTGSQATAVAAQQTQQAQQQQQPLRVVVEYLNEPQLRDFLLRRTKREDGFLQKWVWPNGKHNNVLQAIWTPHACLVSRRRNRCAVRDVRETMYDRAVTYEGPSHLSEESFVADHIRFEVEQFCLSVVRYLYHDHQIPLRRMVLHFKVDWSSRVWFLWASSVRVQEKAQLNLTIAYVARHVYQLERLRFEEEQRAAASLQLQQGSNTNSSHTNPPTVSVHAPQRTEPLRDKFLARQPPQTQRLIRQVVSERQLTHIAFPKAPTMGPLGQLYTCGSLVRPFDDANERHQRRPAKVSAKNGEPKQKRKKKSKKKKSRGLGGDGQSPKVDGMLRNLQEQRSMDHQSSVVVSTGGTDRLAAWEESCHRSVCVLRSDVRSCRRSLLRSTATALWQWLAGLVRDGSFTRFMALSEAVDFLQGCRYNVYSHFLTSEDDLVLVVPHALQRGVPQRRPKGYSTSSVSDDWVNVGALLRQVGLEAVERKVRIAAPPPVQPPSTGNGRQRRRSSIARNRSPNGATPLADPTTAGGGGSSFAFDIAGGGAGIAGQQLSAVLSSMDLAAESAASGSTNHSPAPPPPMPAITPRDPAATRRSDTGASAGGGSRHLSPIDVAPAVASGSPLPSTPSVPTQAEKRDPSPIPPTGVAQPQRRSPAAAVSGGVAASRSRPGSSVISPVQPSLPAACPEGMTFVVKSALRPVADIETAVAVLLRSEVLPALAALTWRLLALRVVRLWAAFRGVSFQDSDAESSQSDEDDDREATSGGEATCDDEARCAAVVNGGAVVAGDDGFHRPSPLPTAPRGGPGVPHRTPSPPAPTTVALSPTYGAIDMSGDAPSPEQDAPSPSLQLASL